MKKTFRHLGIIAIIFMIFQIGNAQNTFNPIKYEINLVTESPRFQSKDIPALAEGSSVRSFGYYGEGGNIGIEAGMSFQFHEKHGLTGRLGVYFITTSATIMQFNPPINVTNGPTISSYPAVYTNGSARLELSHRYLFYNEGKVQFALNSGVGLRYWSWNQTSEINYISFFSEPNSVPLGTYTSYSIRPLHPDLNIGLSLVLKDFFKNIDLCVGYSYLWAPIDAFRVDPLTFRDGAGVEHQFSFDNRVNSGQIRIGFIFSLGRKGVVE